MFPSPIDEEPLLIAVEYDAYGQRVRKTFEDMYEARRFYVAKDKAGKHPRVVKAESENE